MPRIPLDSGSYVARSLIANAQRCVNLYPEENQAEAPTKYTHYLTPGLSLLANAPTPGFGRYLYRASNGVLYACIGAKVYKILANWTFVELGTLTNIGSPVCMQDNSLAIVIVDGTGAGWAIDMATDAFGAIVDDAFYGGDRVDYIDTFFVFNKPGTYIFYISKSLVTFGMLTQTSAPIVSGSITGAGTGGTPGTYSNVALTGGSGTGAKATVTVGGGGTVTTVVITEEGDGYGVDDVLSAASADIGSTTGFAWTVTQVSRAFDDLDFASKIGYPDPINTLIVMHKEIWLIGTQTCEVFFNSGAADFPFQQLPGSFVEHGCVARYSVAKQDLSVYWLGQDAQGRAIVFKGANYRAIRISTHAIEKEISSYNTISDAIGFTYQQEGHTFYVLSFPSANKTWVFDEATLLWHERASMDNNGEFYRWRVGIAANAYNTNVGLDWETGKLYKIDLDTRMEDGNPIVRLRSFPHLVNDGKRVRYDRFILDMETGTIPETMLGDAPKVSLRWSDNHGKSYGNAILLELGATGEYGISMLAKKLGMARDRVYEVSWSGDVATALQGGFSEHTPMKS